MARPQDSELDPFDIATLQDRCNGGWDPKYLFFWGHTPAAGASMGKECLSQWYPAPFTLDGETYGTAEHYMMAQKALMFGDTDTANRIRACKHPAEAKKLGREVQGFDEAQWTVHRFDIVAQASRAKFQQNPDLRAFILATGARVLVEASPTDKIWGIGLAENDPHARDPKHWLGLNVLGFALMHTRSHIRSETPSP
jgi:ribA/ribD-fused uncharacterized protein